MRGFARLRQASRFPIPEQQGIHWGPGAGLREGGFRGWMDWRWRHPGKVKARYLDLTLGEAGALVGFQNQRRGKKPILLLTQTTL